MSANVLNQTVADPIVRLNPKTHGYKRPSSGSPRHLGGAGAFGACNASLAGLLGLVPRQDAYTPPYVVGQIGT